jgi:branched-chain amino acid transport system ATP-binding protein
MMAKPLLLVEDVHIAYGRSPAVNGVSIAVERGEVVALLGPNGAGKSSLLRGISGVARIVRGAVLLAGKDITSYPEWRRARLGVALVPQGRRCFPQLSVRDNLVLGGGTIKKSEFSRRVEDVYEYFPALRTKAGQAAGELSGGQQQMLAIGRALMARPDVLMIDEPSLGLAPAVVKSLAPILQSLAAQRQMAVLLAEQNIGLATACSTSGYVLRSGVCVLRGSLADIAPRLMSVYTGTD